MEQQRPTHYPREEEENEEGLAPRGRLSRHRNNSSGPPHVAVSINSEISGANRVHEEEAGTGIEEDDKEVGATWSWSAKEKEDKEGISTGEVSFQTEHVTGVEYSVTSKQWNVNANRSETRLDVEVVSERKVEEFGSESLSTAAIEAAASSEETKSTSTFEYVENKNGSIEEVALIEVDVGSTEYDVERVIEMQNTHDLFCPNCKKCITRTVILRRKNKPAEVFSCLACLKFFIRKVFPPIDKKPEDSKVKPPEEGQSAVAKPQKPTEEDRSLQNQEPVNISNDSWFFSIFPCIKGNRKVFPPIDKKPEDSKGKPPKPTEENPSLQNQEPVNTSNDSWFFSIFPCIKGNRKDDVKVDKPQDPSGTDSLTEPLLRPEEKPGDLESQPVGSPESKNGGARQVREWDVMKSVVYGGLVESITSLGVVSSAAAAGATTLNIFAMGLANLISGFFVLGHNLRELRKEKSEDETANQLNNQYQMVLGRGNFSVHATVAVISYLVFGLLPPVIYGFSFRVSDNRDYKLAAVLGASLICISLLAIAKCYVNKEPPKSYITTLLYYLSTGAVAACVSYLVGVFIKKLMERLGWFDST